LITGPLLVAAVVFGVWQWLLAIAIGVAVWELSERLYLRLKLTAPKRP